MKAVISVRIWVIFHLDKSKTKIWANFNKKNIFRTDVYQTRTDGYNALDFQR